MLMRKTVHFFLRTGSLFFIFLSLGLSQLTFAEDTNLIHLDQAKKIISQSATPPNFTQANVVSLPDHWQHDPKGFYGSVWYELDIPSPELINQQWAIYLPEVNMNAEVWINNVLIGSGGSMEVPVSRYWHSPLMFVFSPSDLKQQDNKITIRIKSYANEYGQLGRITLGERNIINNLYQKVNFNTVNIHIVAGFLSSVYFIFMSLIWYKRRDPVFFWGALICGMWSVSSLNLYIVDPIFTELSWEKIMQISMGWMPFLFFFFIRRFNNMKYSHRFEGVILLSGILLSFVIVFVSQDNLFQMSRYFHIYTMTWGIVSIVLAFYSWLKNRHASQLSMIFGFTIMAIAGAHDVLVQNKVVESGKTFWLDYSVPIFLLMIGYTMVIRFLAAVKQSEKLNQELEKRVQKAQHKIESDYEKILQLETEQASNHERERIYQNLHDDMGAKLLSLVYKADTEEVGNLAREAMNDLRSIVSKEPQKKHLLNESLNKWHTETINRCTEAHFQINWLQKGIYKRTLINSEQHQNMQRLQSEAISNIIKHSSGDQISITIICRFNCLKIRILDNGDHTDLSSWEEGRGISNMHFRIKQLLGKIRWKAVNNGGVVEWIIPLS